MKLPAISDRNLLMNQLKRSLPMLLLFTIILVLTVPLCAMLSLGQDTLNPVYYSNYQDYLNALDQFAEDIAKGIGYAVVILSSFMGVFAGCTVCRYLMNKTSAVLFGSLPVRREKQLAVSFLTGAVYYLGALLFASLLGLAVFASNGALAQFPIYLEYGLTSVVFFFLFYTLTQLFGMLCGMSSMQFVMTGLCLAYLPATIALLLVTADQFYTHLDLTYYFTWDLAQKLSPAARMFFTVQNPLSLLEYVVFGLLSVLLLLLSGWIYRHRDNAKAGQPFVFDRVASVAKYMLMVPATLFVGCFFYMLESTGWMIAGLAIGAVLSFMLLNVLFSKNARAFFQNIKGLCIYAVAFAACFLLVALDPLGADDYIPAADDLQYVSIDQWGENLQLKTKENIEAVNQIVKYAAEQKNGDSTGLYYPGPISYYAGSEHFRVIYKLKNGVVLSRYIQFEQSEALKPYYDQIYSSQEMTDALWDCFDQMETVMASGLAYQKEGYYYEQFELPQDRAEAFKTLYKQACGEHIFSSDRGPVIMSISDGNYEYPIYLHDDFADCISYLVKHNLYTTSGQLPTKDHLDEFLAGITSATLYNENGEKAETVTDKDQIKQLYENSCGFVSGSFFYSRVAYGRYIDFTSPISGEYLYTRLLH